MILAAAPAAPTVSATSKPCPKRAHPAWQHQPAHSEPMYDGVRRHTCTACGCWGWSSFRSQKPRPYIEKGRHLFEPKSGWRWKFRAATGTP